ncbi:hypothetical protein AYO38_07745 [bacterium SCGC AG-212-C10]|nr:hypothetical protein AYO38_07745 [bacterium SCGC AG-212-C10]
MLALGVQRLAPIGRLGWLRPALGALTAIVLTGLVTRAWHGTNDALPYLVAPMGASAVLLFAVPASPLAQPWPVIGGNTLSAFAGVAASMLVDDRAYAAGLAIAFGITIMSVARCIHPPGGAVALTAVIGGPLITGAGWSFALVPVGLNTVLMVITAYVFNNATRHRYPHRAPAPVANVHGTADPPPGVRAGYTVGDIESVLAHYDELLDVSPGDLDAIFRRLEVRAHRRLHGEIRCGQIMSRDVVTVSPGESIAVARARMEEHRLLAMPVVDGERRVVGLVRHAELESPGVTVWDVMATEVRRTTPDAAIDELLPALSGGVYHEALVVGGDGTLAGMITQTDLLAVLWRGHVAEAVALAGPHPAPSPD